MNETIIHESLLIGVSRPVADILSPPARVGVGPDGWRHPATFPLIGTVPRGPQMLYAVTPESIASAKASQRTERDAVARVLADLDGTQALATLLRWAAR